MASNSGDPTGFTLDCGISFSRIAHWLDGELALPRESSSDADVAAWRYSEAESTCRVEASPLDDGRIGPLAIERTLLTAHGEAHAVASFKRRFTLRFMSAGG